MLSRRPKLPAHAFSVAGMGRPRLRRAFELSCYGTTAKRSSTDQTPGVAHAAFSAALSSSHE